jgi:hypothetical protein
MNIDGSDPVELITEGDVATFDPEFSPDGTRIVFNHSLNGGDTAEIWIGELNAQRTGFTTSWSLTNSGHLIAELDPTWSPDASIVAFSVYEGAGVWHQEGLLPNPATLSQWRIYLIDPGPNGEPGANRRMLVEADTSLWAVPWLPCFSPSGNEVAFVSSRLDPAQWPGDYPFGTTYSELRVINVNGTNERQIPETQGCYWYDWRPSE